MFEKFPANKIFLSIPPFPSARQEGAVVWIVSFVRGLSQPGCYTYNNGIAGTAFPIHNKAECV